MPASPTASRQTPTRLTLPAARSDVLAVVLDPDRLPTPPAVALEVVRAASNPDCNPAEIVALLNRDPALCAKLLKAVNSCVYGLAKPVASVARAVAVLGLNTIRSLALGLSLPAMRAGPAAHEALKDYWVESLSGAIFARELSARIRRPCPEDDLVAGLLRDLGTVLLRLTFPGPWKGLADRDPARRFAEPCRVEEEVFGVNHADVTAELLTMWNLPPEVIEPIRYHHEPERLADTPALADRAKLLYFAGLLTQIDTVTEYPEVLDYVLTLARDRFGLPQPELIRFLEGVVPKVAEFAQLLKVDIGKSPDFAAILSAGASELVNLTVETSRNQLSGSIADKPARRRDAAAAPGMTLNGNPAATLITTGPGKLPAFCPAFLEEFPAGGCRLGQYELREVLGQGAMGVVFKAYEPSLDRFVAVKMLAPWLAAAGAVYRQRFAREARVAAAIQHENVVAIYAVQEAAGLPYLAMEFVAGGMLQDRLETDGPLPVADIARIGRQIASGMAAAHARQIIHRDIKPANILIEAGTGRAKITDFGLARGGDDCKLSQDGSLIGTPHYMSPEQVRGEIAGPRSDLFSLGGVLYALCTGEPPFPGEQLAPVLRAVSDAEPTPPRRRRPDLPPWLDAVVMRLLRKDPAARFQTAGEVAAVIAERGGA